MHWHTHTSCLGMGDAGHAFAVGFLRRAEARPVGLPGAPKDCKDAVKLVPELARTNHASLLLILEAFHVLRKRNVTYSEFELSADNIRTSTHAGFPYSLVALLPTYEAVLVQHTDLHSSYLFGVLDTLVELGSGSVHRSPFVKVCLEFILTATEMWHVGVSESTCLSVFQSFETVLSYGTGAFDDGSSLERLVMTAYRYVCVMKGTHVDDRSIATIRHVIAFLGTRVWVLGSDFCIDLYCGLLETGTASDADAYKALVSLLGRLFLDAEHFDPALLVRVQAILLQRLRVNRAFERYVVSVFIACLNTLEYAHPAVDAALREDIVSHVVRIAHGAVTELAATKKTARSNESGMLLTSLLQSLMGFLSVVSFMSAFSSLALQQGPAIVPVALSVLPLVFNSHNAKDGSMIAWCIAILSNYTSRCVTCRELIVDEDRRTGVTLTLLLRVLVSKASYGDYSTDMLYADVLNAVAYTATCARSLVMQAIEEEVAFHAAVRTENPDDRKRVCALLTKILQYIQNH